MLPTNVTHTTLYVPTLPLAFKRKVSQPNQLAPPPLHISGTGEDVGRVVASAHLGTARTKRLGVKTWVKWDKSGLKPDPMLGARQSLLGKLGAAAWEQFERFA